MSIQRWGNPDWPEWNTPDDDGMYVTYTDHVAAVAEAETRGYVAGVERENRAFAFAYQQGLDAARDAVAATPERAINAKTGDPLVGWTAMRNEALAAIDGLKGDTNG